MRRFSTSPARVVFFFCAMLGVYFASTAVQGAIRNERLDDARMQAEREVLELRAEKAYLEAISSYVSSDEYVEQAARRQLGFVRPGETAFVVVGPAPEIPDTASPFWWERMFPR